MFKCISSWRHWVFAAGCGLSPMATSGGNPLDAVCGLSRCRGRALEHTGPVTVATGFTAPQNLKSPQTRGWTRVPCAGRQIPNHWTTRQLPFCTIYRNVKQCSHHERAWWFLKKLKTNFCMVHQVYIWNMLRRIESVVLKRCLYTRVPSSTTHRSPKVEATQRSTDRWMDRLNLM